MKSVMKWHWVALALMHGCTADPKSSQSETSMAGPSLKTYDFVEENQTFDAGYSGSYHPEDDSVIVLVPNSTRSSRAPVLAVGQTRSILAWIPAEQVLTCLGPKGAFYRGRKEPADRASSRLDLALGAYRPLPAPVGMTLSCEPFDQSSNRPGLAHTVLLDRVITPTWGRLRASLDDRHELHLTRDLDGIVTAIDPGPVVADSRVLSVLAKWLPWDDAVLVQFTPSMPSGQQIVGVLGRDGWLRRPAPLAAGPWHIPKRFAGAPAPFLEVLEPRTPVVTNSLGYVFVGSGENAQTIRTSPANVRVSDDGRHLLSVTIGPDGDDVSRARFRVQVHPLRSTATTGGE